MKNRLDSEETLVLDLVLAVLRCTKGRWTGEEVLEFVYLLEESGGEAFRLSSPAPELCVVHGHKDVGSED